MLKKVRKIICVFLFTFSSIFYFLSIYIKLDFGDFSFEQLLYSLIYSKGSSLDVIINGLLFVCIFLLIYFLLVYFFKLLYLKIKKFNYYIILSFNNYVFKYSFGLNLFYLFIFIIFIYFSLFNLKFFDYYNYHKDFSSFIGDNYVSPRNVNITFYEKRNLIYIYIESLEMTNVSIDNGGAVNNSYIPNLENIALNNINFSNNDKLGGGYVLEGSGWTAGALVSQTSGIPLKVTVGGNEYTGYSSLLPGVYSIGEILEDNGYKNYFILGSDAEFGGRKDYFKQHGDYEIFDYYWAIDSGKIAESYHEWWGYEDRKLFDYTKEQLLNISKKSEPFNFTLLTADTHFTDGYLDDFCTSHFDKKYADSFYCSDNMIYDFIKWIQKQDFYKNTTIVITGDHLTMQNDFYSDIDKSYDRVVYNAFINSSISTDNSKNRLFSTFDMYPTTLAAIGADIEGNRLGLGTNLFSNVSTLSEIYGINYLNSELSKKSDFYNMYLLGDSYFEMKETLKENNS